MPVRRDTRTLASEDVGALMVARRARKSWPAALSVGVLPGVFPYLAGAGVAVSCAVRCSTSPANLRSVAMNCSAKS